MRFGIELTPLTYTLTGVGYYVRHLARELAALSVSDTLCGFVAGVRHLDMDDISMQYKRFPMPPRILRSFWKHTGQPRVDTFLGGVDVYHGVNYVLPPLKHAHSVLSIHDLGFLKKNDWSNPQIASPFRTTIGKDASRADAILTCSEATRNDIVSLLDIQPDKVHVTYYAADISFTPIDKNLAARLIQKALGIEGPYLLFVSTIEKRKNVTGLLSAFARTDIPHKLVLVGAPGWGYQEIMEQVTALHLDDRVVFSGYLPDRSLFPALYSAADAFVFPSWYEGFGLALLEAMSCGCPVIASNSSSLPEVGGDAPLYVNPEYMDELTSNMELVCHDDVLRENMRKKGLLQAHQFSWSKCAEETLACYRSLE
jgi:glycosyltransferase involved in cell wall biosynthesis